MRILRIKEKDSKKVGDEVKEGEKKRVNEVGQRWKNIAGWWHTNCCDYSHRLATRKDKRGEVLEVNL